MDPREVAHDCHFMNGGGKSHTLPFYNGGGKSHTLPFYNGGGKSHTLPFYNWMLLRNLIFVDDKLLTLI